MNTYGYAEGLLSNSMLQAAIVCPVKYKILYVDGIRPERNGLWFNEAFAGNVVHDCIEHHDDDHAAAVEHMWIEVEEFFGKNIVHRTRSLLRLYEDAVAKTMADGARWGRVYKAPEMTGFWKKNYGGLDALLDELSRDAQAQVPGGVFDMKYIDLVKRMLVSLNNWRTMRIGSAVANEIQLQGEVGPHDARTRMVGTADRLEDRGAPKRVALCDYKTGKWAYDEHDLLNSDQFGLYDLFLNQEGYTVVEWVLYDVFVGSTVRVRPNEGVRAAFQRRLDTNLRYFKQLQLMIDGNVEVPTPAGSHFKTGCPCILAETGDCPYVYKPQA